MTAIGSESIRDLLSTAGPCITIVSSEAKLPDSIESVRKLLHERGKQHEALLAPVLQAEQGLAAEGKWDHPATSAKTRVLQLRS